MPNRQMPHYPDEPSYTPSPIFDWMYKDIIAKLARVRTNLDPSLISEIEDRRGEIPAYAYEAEHRYKPSLHFPDTATYPSINVPNPPRPEIEDWSLSEPTPEYNQARLEIADFIDSLMRREQP